MKREGPRKGGGNERYCKATQLSKYYESGEGGGVGEHKEGKTLSIHLEGGKKGFLKGRQRGKEEGNGGRCWVNRTKQCGGKTEERKKITLMPKRSRGGGEKKKRARKEKGNRTFPGGFHGRGPRGEVLKKREKWKQKLPKRKKKTC